MMELRFRGWFQCRLATDPDPYDEPRGVSGYVQAYVGEPDLDRIVCFHKPYFSRDYAPSVGVRIDQLLRNDQPIERSPLVGSGVDLAGAPKFEGRNGVIAEDGLEPIYPFELAITHGPFRLRRAVRPNDPSFPFTDLLGQGVEFAPDVIRDATGIPSLLPVWQERLGRLRADEPAAEDPKKTAIRERIGFLERNLAAGGGAARFFGALIRYDYALASASTVDDPDQLLPEVPARDTPWRVQFWMGGWDADVLCGYCRGSLTIPGDGEQVRVVSQIHRVGKEVALA
jgi:hypothetical protein